MSLIVSSFCLVKSSIFVAILNAPWYVAPCCAENISAEGALSVQQSWTEVRKLGGGEGGLLSSLKVGLENNDLMGVYNGME
jgi:hypothetical protein